jgi:phage baseplate assembly protein W
MAENIVPPVPIGWPLLPVPDENGELSYPSSLAESVRQQLRVILSTVPGEQLMRPRFGVGLTTFLRQPNDLTTRRRIYDRVSSGIGRWEPRVEVNRIDIDDIPGRPGQIRVEIGYRLRRTGEVGTIGLNLEI